MRTHRMDRRNEGGVALAALVLTLAPLMVLTAAGVLSMKGRTALTVSTIEQEMALMAAESGIDYMLHQVNTSAIVNNAKVEVDLGRGMSFTATAVDMLTDGIDNDGNGLVDDIEETGWELTVIGRYRGTNRRLVSWIKPIITIPPLTAAANLQDPAASLEIQGSAFSITGLDTNLDGTPGLAPPVTGVEILDPGTVSQLLASLNATQQLQITGEGGAPSAGVTTTYLNVPDLVAQVGLVADNALVGGHYTRVPNFGAPRDGEWRITHVAGNFKLTGNQSGAGILAVDGDLELGGTVDFLGIVLVSGNIRFSGGGSSKMLRGGLLVGGDANVGGVFSLNGTVDIQYSNQAVTAARQVANRHMVSGWREISRS